MKKLQVKLGLNADGSFGFGTEAAVKQWQQDNGLTPDGLVGDGTWNKMFGSPQPPAQAISTSNTSDGNIKLDKLKGHIPDSVIAQIPDTIQKFQINTPERLAHFLAQCSHESGGFRLTQENLNYSAKGLAGTFRKYFLTEDSAKSYERNPEKIASKIYGGRMGNGPEETKDGYKFRGRGFIQLTGKDNYTAFGKSINEDIVSNPDLVATKYPLLSAAWFFSKNCLKRCDLGSGEDAVLAVTKCVNGGTIGLAERSKEFKLFYQLLS